MNTEKRTIPQMIKGKVISDKMDKTRVIEIPRRVIHRLYQKQTMRSRKLFVHDEKNESKVGDVILAMGTRPLSRHKHFKLKEILSRGVKEL